jgi:Rho-binding antiterminator
MALASPPISCAAYEGLELSCMLRQSITLQLHDGQQLSGIALDLVHREQIEYLQIQCETNVPLIRLDQIAFMLNVTDATHLPVMITPPTV